MKYLYNLSIYLYSIAIHIASVFNNKAKLWVKGRKSIFKKLENDFKNQLVKEPLLWIHCASLGEFEQGRPLIEKIKKDKKKIKVLLTFFSPSGYEIRKNYSVADYVYYLPADTTFNAKKFISIVQPSAALFVKYEFWFNYLNELKTQHIPTYLVCGIFRPDQHFFKNYGTWFREQLGAFTHFYLQDKDSENLLNQIGYKNTTVAGDTRFDRVIEIAAKAREISYLEQFINHEKVIIAGSTWPEDTRHLAQLQFRKDGYKMVIAPHEIHESGIQAILSAFSNSELKALRYSQANAQTVTDIDILIIDSIGILSSLYQYGTMAYIGGGFGKGIHNILEAATFGLPVIFGPNYHKFNEARELIQRGGAFSISNAEELKKTVALLNNSDVHRMASFASKNYVVSMAGATDKILSTVALPNESF